MRFDGPCVYIKGCAASTPLEIPAFDTCGARGNPVVFTSVRNHKYETEIPASWYVVHSAAKLSYSRITFELVINYLSFQQHRTVRRRMRCLFADKENYLCLFHVILNNWYPLRKKVPSFKQNIPCKLWPGSLNSYIPPSQLYSLNSNIDDAFKDILYKCHSTNRCRYWNTVTFKQWRTADEAKTTHSKILSVGGKICLCLDKYHTVK